MNLVHSLLSAFGGSVNLTAVLALLGGYTGISMILMSPVMAFIIKVKWSTSEKNIAVWIVSFGVIGVGMYIAHAFTGTLWDVGTWITAWGALSVGATTLHDKFWGSNGTGLSTFIEKNFFPGTDVAVPTTAADLLPAAEQIGKELFEAWLKSKGEALPMPSVYTGAGTAGAVPNPSLAPLAGGATLDTSTPVSPTGMAAQAELAAVDAHASTGQNVVSDPTSLPVVPLTAPLITPAPSVQAQVNAVTAAIASGTPVEAIAAGGSE